RPRARSGRVTLIQERATGRDVILAVAENMRSSLEPLVTKTIGPSLYQGYLHSADYEHLRTIFGELETEAKELLERELARLNRGASTAAHRLLSPLRAWRRGRGDRGAAAEAGGGSGAGTAGRRGGGPPPARGRSGG